MAMQTAEHVGKGKKDKLQIDEGTVGLASGTALGALAVGELALLGVACPLCIIGAPALIGFGAYAKIRKKKKAKKVLSNEKSGPEGSKGSKQE